MRGAGRCFQSGLKAWLRAVCGLLCVALTAAGGLARPPRQKAPPLSRAEVLEAERRLGELGYWAGEADGTWDALSRHALVAFQKIEGRERTGRLTKAELQALQDARRPLPREGAPAHVEIDIKRQVLFFVDDGGAVAKILPVSTGNEERYFDQGKWQRAHTPRGRFRIERKIEGWRRSTLGLLYYPCYFSGGVAIHGSPSVPASPSSHGCIRIPVFAARGLSRMAPVGTVVIVHDGEGRASTPPLEKESR